MRKTVPEIMLGGTIGYDRVATSISQEALLLLLKCHMSLASVA